MPEYVPLVVDRILHFVMNLDDTDTSSAAASTSVGGSGSGGSSAAARHTSKAAELIKSDSLFLSLQRCARALFAACAHSAPLLFARQLVPRVLNAALTEAPRTPTSAAYFSMLLSAAVAAAPALVGDAGMATAVRLMRSMICACKNQSVPITIHLSPHKILVECPIQRHSLFFLDQSSNALSQQVFVVFT
jgi:hypothetical protein